MFLTTESFSYIFNYSMYKNIENKIFQAHKYINLQHTRCNAQESKITIEMTIFFPKNS